MEVLQYGTTSLAYELIYMERTTLSIEVHPDLEVKVLAPLASEKAAIEKKVLKKASWIIKQREYFAAFLPRTPEREYVSGETHLYLGKRYLLKVREADKEEVKLKGGSINVYCKSVSSQKARHLLTAWYSQHATRVFQKHFENALLAFKRFNLEKPELTYMRMSKRWGSCTKQGKIILNPELIKAPTRCIDYVIYHELCHLIEPNHNSSFYKLQEEMFPENTYWKSRLEEVMR